MSLQNRVVSVSDTGALHATDFANGTVLLMISSLNSSLVGTYTCTANNTRGMNMTTTQVFGPPPSPPNNPVIMIAGNVITVSWMRPTARAITITQYLVQVYQ